MRTGVSGMNAQSSKLGTVADNIANSNTTGYKRAGTEFSSMVLSQGSGKYNSGAVKAHTVYSISSQGPISYTTSNLNLAIDGNGFFVVADPDGTPVLTRAGAFVVDKEGYLVNTAGYQLQGYPITDGVSTTPVANGLGGLESVNVSQNQLVATPTTDAMLWTNVPEDAAIVAAANLPSTNAAGATYTAKTSLEVFDNLGNVVKLDIYYSKTAETTGDSTWEVAVYNSADAGAGGGFPYASGPLSTQTLTFSRTTGKLDAASATSINIAVPNGGTFDLDLSGSTSVAADFSVSEVDRNGNAPSAVESVEFSSDGTLSAVYADGTRRAIYRIPLADVPSPDKLNVLSGNIYTTSNDSGELRVGFPGENGLGKLEVGAKEDSNVDIATELTSMIESQRAFTANSKVFKAGSDLLEELVNLAR
jgi:flagellar hook protein FlgE